MAISNYYDVYNVKDYKVRVDDLESSISNLKNNNFYTDAINEVKRQIEVLEQKERKMFKLLKVNNIQELNNRLEEYKKAVINLSGAGLNQAFIAILKEKNQEEYEAFNEAVMSVINEDLFQNKAIDQLEKNGKDIILEALNKGMNRKGNTNFRSERGISTQQIFPASFTKEQKDRWKEILKEKYSKKPKVQKYLEVQTASNQNQMQTIFTWSGITENLTPTEAKERLTENEINEINRNIKTLILSKITNDKNLISEIIDHILSKDNTVFFVGKNINDITGILGEIQGLYYISKFLGGNLSEAISWQGGLHTAKDGKKPHRDILLEEFGIQVKNTTKDIIGRIDFISNDINTFLNKINLSQDTKNIFLNFYATAAFNVEYHMDRRRKKGHQYISGLNLKDNNAIKFRDLRNKLLSFDSDIDKLLSLFGATFMYLDVAEKGKNIDANSLFLLGGVAFQTASQILSDILEDLNREKYRFKVSMDFKETKNIIDALNSGSRGTSYSKALIRDIKLTSSYLF